jgi:hypothetical protein
MIVTVFCCSEPATIVRMIRHYTPEGLEPASSHDRLGSVGAALGASSVTGRSGRHSNVLRARSHTAAKKCRGTIVASAASVLASGSLVLRATDPELARPMIESL